MLFMLPVYNNILYLVTQTYHYLISATTPVLQYGRTKNTSIFIHKLVPFKYNELPECFRGCRNQVLGTDIIPPGRLSIFDNYLSQNEAPLELHFEISSKFQCISGRKIQYEKIIIILHFALTHHALCYCDRHMFSLIKYGAFSKPTQC